MNNYNNPIGLNEHGENIHKFSHKAMATIFEIFIRHDDPKYAEQSAYAAFAELDRLEQELSRFIESSDISRINSLSQLESITVGIDTFGCLKECVKLYQESKGIFDISTGNLIELWKKSDKSNSSPNDEISHILKNVGLPWLHLDEGEFKVQLMNNSITLDLGGFGKGYAIDRMRETLVEWNIESGLIHGGLSTVLAFGSPENEYLWALSLKHPENINHVLQNVDLTIGAISSSGIKKGQHIINPETGSPVKGRLATWVISPQASTSDALSTTFMIMSYQEIEKYCETHPQTSALILENSTENRIRLFGKEWEKIISQPEPSASKSNFNRTEV